MADPVGIVGTAAGIVSLGLQLYGGITTYCDALEGREDDLASARAQLDSLRDSLVTIQSVLPSLVSATASTGSSISPPIVRECEKELSQLDTLLQELAGSSTSTKKLKDRVKTLRFPFRRDNLMKLEDRLHKTNAVFQTALSVFHLNKSLDNEQKLANVEVAMTQIPAINTTVVNTNTYVQEIKAGVGQISNEMNMAMSTLHSSNDAVHNLANDFATFAPATNAQLGDIRLGMGALAQGDDIRQLTSIAVNNANMLATMERRMQTLSVLEERLGLLADSDHSRGIENIQAQDPRFTLQRLLAKPSQTREIFDSLDPLRSTTRIRDSSFQKALGLSLGSKFQGPSCTCLRRKIRQGTSRNFGPFWLRTETSYDGHSQNCRIAKWQLGKQRCWFELTTARRYSFWSWAVAVSLAINTGAGGLSISPNVSYRPVVDEERSPVFRVLNSLEMLLQWYSGHILSLSEIPRCLEAVASTILTLYQEKKAFPDEVNARGQSAIFKMVRILVSNNLHLLDETYSDFILWGVKAGLPANIVDFSGRTPAIDFIVASNYESRKVMRLLPILYNEVPEPVMDRNTLKKLMDSTYSVEYYVHTVESINKLHDLSLETSILNIRAELFNYGPLSTAIFTQRKDEDVNDLIVAMNMSEVNVFGQTPLHIAAGMGNTTVLAALLRSPDILDILHLRDIEGDDAIEYAVWNSMSRCSEPSSHIPCSGCACTDALDMLLSVEGSFDGFLEDSTNPERFEEVIRSGSLRSTLLVMSKLKLKRDQVKNLALEHLDQGDIQRYRLDKNNVLDYYGIDVVQRLVDMGIKVPAALTNSFIRSAHGRSIYHVLSPLWPWLAEASLLQLIFDLGFHDTNEPNDLGHTPIMQICNKKFARPVILLWFANHGADLTSENTCTRGERTHHYHSNPTVAQQSLDWLSGWLFVPTSWTPENASLLTRVLSLDAADGCECYCTEDGCSPASILFWGLWKEFQDGGSYPFRPYNAPRAVSWGIALILRKIPWDLPYHRHVHLAAFRMLTFEALGISHTCGCRNTWDEPRLSSDTIEEMWEEDAHEIEQLEELLSEFEAEFDASGMDIATFLVTKWARRLKDVLGEVDEHELSEAERESAEAIGVKWHTQAEFQPSHDRRMTVEDFFRVLREIEKG